MREALAGRRGRGGVASAGLLHSSVEVFFAAKSPPAGFAQFPRVTALLRLTPKPFFLPRRRTLSWGTL